jgi:hypothetical protein
MDFFRNAWDFISDPLDRDNVSYNHQYLNWLLYIYMEGPNKIYGSIESLHFKTIIVTIGSIIEAALHSILSNKISKKKLKQLDFDGLINEAVSLNIINDSLAKELHKLRIDRNKIHFRKSKGSEYWNYNLPTAKKYLKIIDDFIKNFAIAPTS